jgi:hypothetical protein
VPLQKNYLFDGNLVLYQVETSAKVSGKIVLTISKNKFNTLK